MPIAVNYFINEGNKIGFVDTMFDENTNPTTLNLFAVGPLKKGQVVEVVSSADGKTGIRATTGVSANVIGVSMFDYLDGEEVAVCTEGLLALKAAGAITTPSKVTSAADGQIAAGTTNVIGIAISNAAVAGDLVYVKFTL